MEQDLRKSLIGKSKEMLTKILGVVNLLKTRVEVDTLLLKEIVEMCRKEEKAFDGEIKLILQSFNRLNQ